MRVALWIANMLKVETLAGRKAEGTVALPSHLSPGHKDMEGWRHAWPKAGAGIELPWIEATYSRGR